MATRVVNVVLRGSGNLNQTLASNAASASAASAAMQGLSASTGQARDARGRFVSGSGAANNSITSMGNSARGADASINKLTGRMLLLARIGATLGPTLAPIGAVGIQGVMGLANQLGAAAIAGGAAILAFQGVGDALDAVNTAQLEPTADNLNAAREAMASLSPAAADFVTQLQGLRPVLDDLTDVSATGMFPGFSEGLDSLTTRLPDVERLLSGVSTTMGDLAASAGDALAGPEFDDFFDFLATEMPPTLQQLGEAVGNVTQGLAELWMAFQPLNADFSSGLLSAAEGFNEWAQGLAQTQGFQDFVTYVQANGPRVVEAVGSIANALVQIVTAAAPLGGPTLQILASFADALAAIAGSDFGTPILAAVSALSAFRLAMSAFTAVKTSTAVANLTAQFGTGLVGAMNAATVAAAGLAVALPVGIALMAGQMDDANLSAQQMAEGLDALATNEPTAVFDDLSFSLDNLGEALHNAAFDDLSGLFGSADEIAKIDTALTSMFAQDPTQARAAFQGIMEDAEAAGVPIENLLELFPQLDAAAGAAGVAITEAPNVTPWMDMSAGIGSLENDFGDAATAAERLSTVMAELQGFLDKRAAFRNYQAALDDLTASVKENGRSLNRNSEQGRANEAALDGIASSAAQVAEHLNETNRTRFMARAERDIRARARELGLPREAVQRLIAKLHELDGTSADPKADVNDKPANDAITRLLIRLGFLDRSNAEPKVNVNNKPALGAMAGVAAGLTALDRRNATPSVSVNAGSALGTISAIQSGLNSLQSKTVTVTVNRIARGSAQLGVATGGYVTGPGTATSDSIDARLSNGEYVARAAAVDYYGREFFDRVNSLAYAKGGLVTPSGPPSPRTASASGRAQRIEMTGWLDTPWGPAQVRGIALDAAESVVDRHRDHDRMRSRAGVGAG